MPYLALASDYDGTLARHGAVDPPTRAALERLRAAGRRLILVTGREINDLAQVFPPLTLFDRIVAENGGVLYAPDSRRERILAEPPPAALVEELQRRRVEPLARGRVIIATWRTNEPAVQESLRRLGLDWRIVFNKASLMVLPSGTDKGTGLQAALGELALPPASVVAIGDAENDREFLRRSCCGLAVAVANALPELRREADLVTAGEYGAGVAEVIEQCLADQLPPPNSRA